MAKASTKKTSINMTVLQALATAAAANTVAYVSQADGLPLLNNTPPLIEVNTAMVDASGNAAARLTDAGRAMLAGNAAAPAGAAAPASPYAVISGAVLPPSKRGNAKGGGAPTIYPFETMEIGQSFFVPISEKHPDPVKTLGSTVSSANIKFSEPTGEKKTVKRAKRGAGNKAVLDASGAKIMEEVQVDVRKPLRKFAIRKVESGKVYGAWTATADGALIARVEVDAAE